jgi:hypothetical protein
MGPNTNDRELLKKLIQNGMDVARFNFSHGTHDEQRARYKQLREVAERFLDVILRCLFVHSKDLIVINISHSLLVLLSKYHKTNNTPICFTHY